MTHKNTAATVPATSPSMSTAGGAKRGRKPGVKTVSEDIERRRRNWLAATLAERGANAELCRLLLAPDSFVSHLASGRRTFTDAIAARIEHVLGLDEGSIDAGIHVSLKPLPVSKGARAGHRLSPGLKRVLTASLGRALREKRLTDSAAIHLIQEIVSL